MSKWGRPTAEVETEGVRRLPASTSGANKEVASALGVMPSVSCNDPLSVHGVAVSRSALCSKSEDNIHTREPSEDACLNSAALASEVSSDATSEQLRASGGVRGHGVNAGGALPVSSPIEGSLGEAWPRLPQRCSPHKVESPLDAIPVRSPPHLGSASGAFTDWSVDEARAPIADTSSADAIASINARDNADGESSARIPVFDPGGTPGSENVTDSTPEQDLLISEAQTNDCYFAHGVLENCSSHDNSNILDAEEWPSMPTLTLQRAAEPPLTRVGGAILADTSPFSSAESADNHPVQGSDLDPDTRADSSSTCRDRARQSYAQAAAAAAQLPAPRTRNSGTAARTWCSASSSSSSRWSPSRAHWREGGWQSWWGTDWGHDNSAEARKSTISSRAAQTTCHPEVQGLMAWLATLHLAHYEAEARAWCAGEGIADVEQAWDKRESLATWLGLKPLERKRLSRERPPDLSLLYTIPESTSSTRTPVGSPRLGPDGAFPALQIVAPGRNLRPGDVFGPPDMLYKVEEELGVGATSMVYRCTRGADVFAVKAVDLTRFRFQRDFPTVLERLHRETAILFALRHPNVVTLFDVLQTPQKLLLVMEHVEGGDLQDVILRGALPEHEARYIFLQIVQGLRHIHSKGVAHRDLKPDNILIDGRVSRSELLHVKVSDFGHSKLVNGGHSTAQTRCGTPQYWAPEVADHSRCARGYDERVDLWSLGVVLYVMLEGALPFGEDMGGLRFKTDSQIRPLAQNLVRSLVQQRPRDRLPLDECLQHQWVALPTGPLSRCLARFEAEERRHHGECERVVPLPYALENEGAQRLRSELQALTVRFRLPMVFQRTGVSFCSTASSLDRVEVAWEALMCTLERNFPPTNEAEGFERRWRLDSPELLAPRLHASMPSTVDDAEGLEVAFQDDASDAGDTGDALSGKPAVASPEELRQHDLELEAVRNSAVEANARPSLLVCAAVGDSAPVPRVAELHLRPAPGYHVELNVQLPQGYPGNGVSLQLTSLALSGFRGQNDQPQEEAEASMRARIAESLVSQHMTLANVVEWLRTDLLPTLVPSEPVDGAGRGRASSGKVTLPADCEVDRDHGGVDSEGIGDRADDSPLAKCARACLLVAAHDDQLDKKGMGQKQSKRPGSSNRSFFQHLRGSYPDVSGFLSFGRPAVLLVEGPLADVDSLIFEAQHFRYWTDREVRAYDHDVSCRAFEPPLQRVKTEDTLDLLSEGRGFAGDLWSYGALLAGTRRRPRVSR